MLEDKTNKEIDLIVHQKYSADLFQDQKRKICEIKSTINDNHLNINSDKAALVITPHQRSKNKNKKSGGKDKVTEDTEQATVSQFEPYGLKNKDLCLSLEDFESWDYSSFDYEIIESEDVPIINSPFWPFEELGGYNKDNGVDIRNIVLKSICQFNMAK